MNLTNRERFVKLFNGEELDRCPFLDIMGFWPSTLDRWKREGLDSDATYETVNKIIGFDSTRRRGFKLPVNGYILPEFERKVLADDGRKLTVRNRWGGIEQDLQDPDMLPITIAGPVTDRASWEDIKERLDPDTPGRLGENWNDICRQASESGEPVYAGDLPHGFFGALRELMGFEQLAMMFYDDPDLMHDILDTLCEMWIKLFSRVQKDITLDWYFIWEDMCSKNGPLISPAIFSEFFLPRYQRFTASLRQGGCKNIFVDSDGDIRPLVDMWIEGGVNILFPWETQFGLDITEVRRQWPTLGMIGGLNKYALSQDRDAIDKELEKIPFMLERGRYIPGLDHGVPNDVSWDNYRYFYDHLKEMIWKYPPCRHH